MVSEHGFPLELDGRCVGHAFMSITYVFLILLIHVIVVHAWWWSCLPVIM